MDGASSGNPGHAGVGVILYAPGGEEVFRDSLYLGKSTNNVSEYEAVKYALKKALDFGAEEIVIYSDSQLLVNQINGVFKVRDQKLKGRADEVRQLIAGFKRFLIQYIPREKNKEADRLAKEAIKRGRRVTAPDQGEESPGTAGQGGL